MSSIGVFSDLSIFNQWLLKHQECIDPAIWEYNETTGYYTVTCSCDNRTYFITENLYNLFAS